MESPRGVFFPKQSSRRLLLFVFQSVLVDAELGLESGDDGEKPLNLLLEVAAFFTEQIHWIQILELRLQAVQFTGLGGDHLHDLLDEVLQSRQIKFCGFVHRILLVFRHVGFRATATQQIGQIFQKSHDVIPFQIARQVAAPDGVRERRHEYQISEGDARGISKTEITVTQLQTNAKSSDTVFFLGLRSFYIVTLGC